MLFNSLEFLIFFPVVVIIFFAIPHRFRWILLLSASYYFYMSWKAEYVLLIIASTLIDYYAGLKMGSTPEIGRRKNYVILSILSNLIFLFSFKYFNFFNDSFREFLNYLNIFYDVPSFNLLLPVGISFYTFQSLSYSIDVYRGEREPERHLGYFALYVAYFPQLVAGPIERSKRLLPQFYQEHKFDYHRVTDGLQLMLWGFFKKIVIADRLAIYVNEVYNNPADYYGLHIILATYFFAFQIYCDFSGYTDIAIGAAKIMGIDLMKNFDRPYFSKSIAEFWKRWHISLSTWFKDYLYVSMGGNRVFKWRWYYNLFVVFLISGFWHGANWTFIIWGALHGFYMVFAIWTKKLRFKATNSNLFIRLIFNNKYAKIFFTFHLVFFGWMIFRSNSMADVFILINNALEINFSQLATLKLSTSWYEFTITIFSLLILEFVHFLQGRYSISKIINNRPIFLRYALYYVVIFYILIFGQFDQTDFIYFQF
jgi:alginate O-acetyltransferase complex protein AlgI